MNAVAEQSRVRTYRRVQAIISTPRTSPVKVIEKIFRGKEKAADTGICSDAYFAVLDLIRQKRGVLQKDLNVAFAKACGELKNFSDCGITVQFEFDTVVR